MVYLTQTTGDSRATEGTRESLLTSFLKRGSKTVTGVRQERSYDGGGPLPSRQGFDNRTNFDGRRICSSSSVRRNLSVGFISPLFLSGIQ